MYHTFSNSVLIQYGLSSGNSTDHVVTLPISYFSKDTYQTVISRKDTAMALAEYVYTVTGTTFKIFQNLPNHWITVGY